MKPLVLLLGFGLGLSHAAETNFFISPGSQADQLASGNHTDQYPVYQERRETLFSWHTNWTRISLLLYQNENASYIRLLDAEENPPNSYTYNMTPPVDLSWNDVFFLTLWNENWGSEGGARFFSSSYFRINASDSAPSTATTTTPTSTSTSTSTVSPTSPPQTTDPSSDSGDSSSGLSSSAKVGLGVGIGLGIPALALAGVAIFYYRRRSQAVAWQREQQFQQQQQPPQPQPQPPYNPYGSAPPVSEMNNPNPPPFKLGHQPGAFSETNGASAAVHVPGSSHQSVFQELPGEYGR